MEDLKSRNGCPLLENNGASDIDTAKLRRSRNKATMRCKGCSKLMCGMCAAAHSIQALEGPG